MARTRNTIIEYDELQMYFGKPYVIDVENTVGTITVYTPTIGDIMEIGDSKFYSTLNIFTTNTTQNRLMLWNSGIDWNEITDFDLFILMYQSIDSDVSKLLFGDLDWSNFKPYSKQTDGKEPYSVLWDEENQIEINEIVYQHFCQYLRTVFNIFPEEKLTTQKMMKEWFIAKDKRQLKIDAEKKERGMKKNGSVLKALISSCVNHPGFKYNLEQLKDVNVCQFYDSVKRLQLYEQATACLKGMYSGFVDGSKIPAESYNFMKEI